MSVGTSTDLSGDLTGFCVLEVARTPVVTAMFNALSVACSCSREATGVLAADDGTIRGGSTGCTTRDAVVGADEVVAVVPLKCDAGGG